MRRIACAMAVALLLTTASGGFGCHNERGEDGPDGGTGPCNPAVSISVSPASGGFEVYWGDDQVTSSDGSNVINALCGNCSGSSIRVVVHDRATFFSRTAGRFYPLMYDWDGDSSPSRLTGLFTTGGPGTVTITVP